VAKVFVPSLLRDLAGGRDHVTVAGGSLREVLGSLEAACPGIRERLCTPDGAIQPHMIVAVDGEEAVIGLRTPVGPESEIHFLPAIAGGAGVEAAYLKAVTDRFLEAKRTAEGALAQLTDEQLFCSPDPESNSIAVILRHVSGNMISRWTDFFTTDGEKPDRDRDSEFLPPETTRQQLMGMWEGGWEVFLGTLRSITEADLLRTVAIRKQPHTVIEAIERQMYHYSYHIGQIVYIAKLLKSAEWQTLTIPKKR
jgi:molybdopterin converting factor small subunit